MDDDLVFQEGDFLVGETTHQHKRHLLISSPGEMRQSVPVGIGIERHVFAEDTEQMLSDVREQFELDGMTVYEVAISDGALMERSVYD
jgi:hypothetical protein